MAKLTHIDETGAARMVDVGAKAVSQRVAVAGGSIAMAPDTLALLESGGHKKGDVLAVARIAGIQAAKKCSDLIPLCHPLALNSIDIDIREKDKTNVLITCTVETEGKTGVEMEALSGATVAALTIYDMCKAISHGMIIKEVKLVKKSGGKSDFDQLAGESI